MNFFAHLGKLLWSFPTRGVQRWGLRVALLMEQFSQSSAKVPQNNHYSILFG